jgi:hypothetical protein
MKYNATSMTHRLKDRFLIIFLRSNIPENTLTGQLP